MSEHIENIGKRDVAWGYAATLFSVGAGVILLPFILHQMSAEMVSIWNIFQTVTILTMMLDFGFRPAFSRNVSYIFAGVQSLRTEGVEGAEEEVNYSLLRGTLKAMRKFYSWMALGLLILLATAGTAYMAVLMNKYDGDKTDVMIAWGMLVAINCYNLYTYYYDALLTGKGYIRRMHQITIVGQSVYLIVAVGLIYAGLGLSAIVAAQVLNTIIKRVLTYRVFFTREMKQKIAAADEADSREIMRAIAPNAIKVGLTGLGGFMVNRSSLLLGNIFLSLDVMAAYGITLQVMDILSRCATVIYQAYMPRLAQCRAERDMAGLRKYYTWSTMGLIVIYVVGGVLWCLLGDWALGIIHSETQFLATGMLVAMLIISLLEQNHGMAAGFIMADNKVPFFIPSLVSGAAVVVVLWAMLGSLQMGVWGLILAPGIVQLCYQNWKWPSMVIRELKTKN